MKLLKFLPLLAVLFLASCSSVQVNTDYDSSVNFNEFKTYAFMKDGVDKINISDLDKKRILKAIDEQMAAKGYTKSENPDLLINLFTDAKQVVHVNNYGGWGYGYYRPWGWNPWMMGPGYQSVSTSTQGILFIDVLKASNKELIWQGKGTGYLTNKQSKKEERTKEFVTKVLETFPNK
ncbi:DUF4136 domain-containing protein [Flavobacterium sp. xlx-214]|uniref:DUF4136 domain-containing protein n=1 Tax=unclassified Flavobacterium TaxID=196869 RepID=UPI0013D15B74|nr:MULTISPECIES: DUF4136 domain-containing protein [unclassified Flavobacterium]MBA5793374.1 DUF4136 domain-containing protein [Flavobacterium sp. xlx-221]QMI84065.1 DUF4136 domain-containing protein [Flavobacterium sp. xlx-214]